MEFRFAQGNTRVAPALVYRMIFASGAYGALAMDLAFFRGRMCRPAGIDP